MDLHCSWKLDPDLQRVKSWIPIRSKVKIQELSRLKMGPWWAVDAQNGGVEAQN
jgi:hypothetical protein